MPTRAELNTDVDEKIRDKTVLDKVDNIEDADNRDLILDYVDQEVSLKQNTITATSSADYYRGDKTFQTLNKTAVGLSNVDNTSDTNKPVSSATQTAINTATATTTKVVKTTITQSQILALNTTPIVILQNADNAIFRCPLSVLIKRVAGGTNYDLGTNNIYIKSNYSSFPIQINRQVLTGTSLCAVGICDTFYTYETVFFASEFTLFVESANPTLGTGGIDVYVTYIDITL